MKHPSTATHADFHEAGHAVVAVAVGYEVTGIWTYGPNDGYTGFRFPPGEITTIAGRRRLLTVEAAGEVAESIAFNFQLDDASVRDVDAGREAAELAWFSATPEERQNETRLEEMANEAIRAARTVARELLARDWEDVVQIARCL